MRKALFAVLVHMAAMAGLAGEISVSGNGVVRVQPDKMKITFSVYATDRAMAEARRLFDERTFALSKVFEYVGIATNEVVTSGMYGRAEYDYENGKRVFSGYRVDEGYTFSARVDRARLAKLTAAILDSGVVDELNVSFELFDEAAARNEARVKAVQNAKEIALSLAEAAGVRLGRIEIIEYGTSGGGMPRYANFALKAMGSSDFGAESVQLGELRAIEVTDSVNIKWQIR
jgi:hypothetical protein